MKDFTDGKGVDIVLDMVGGDYLPRNIQCLAEDGRHVSIAVQRGAKAEIPIWEIMRRRLILTGSTLRGRDRAFKAMVADELSRLVWPHVEEGRLRPVIDRSFPLAEAAEAHRRMEGGDHMGKIVLTMGRVGRLRVYAETGRGTFCGTGGSADLDPAAKIATDRTTGSAVFPRRIHGGGDGAGWRPDRTGLRGSGKRMGDGGAGAGGVAARAADPGVFRRLRRRPRCVVSRPPMCRRPTSSSVPPTTMKRC